MPKKRTPDKKAGAGTDSTDAELLELLRERKQMALTDPTHAEIMELLWERWQVAMDRVYAKARLSYQDVLTLIDFRKRLPGVDMWYRATDDIRGGSKAHLDCAFAEGAIMAEAERRDLDSSSIAESGRICRDIMLHREYFPRAHHKDTWPECIPEALLAASDHIKDTLKAERAILDRLEAKMAAEAADTARAATITPQAENVAGATASKPWQAVRGELLAMKEAGQSYTNLADLAKRCQCTIHAVRRALRETMTLRAWQPQRRGKLPTAKSLGAFHLDNTRADVPDPAQAAAEAVDLDATFSRLLQEAKPEERAKLHAMSPDKQMELARLCLKKGLNDKSRA